MKKTVIQAVHEIGRLVFTTREIAMLTGSSTSGVVQSLGRLAKQGVIGKLKQGVWGFTKDRRFSPFLVVPYLSPNQQMYISFLCALHLHGVVGQIPQVVTVASTMHSKRVKTSVAVFDCHQLSPAFFIGFDWFEGGGFLIAEPEKALVDCLYLSSRKKRQFANFPELDLSKIDKKKALAWANKIDNERIRGLVLKRLSGIFAGK